MHINKHKALKLCAYALLLIAVFALQSANGTAITLWGAKLDATPFLVAAIALFEGPYVGGAFGFAAGLLASIHSPMVEGLSALYLGLFGIAFGYLGAMYMRRMLVAGLLGGLGCIALQGVVRYVFYSRLIYGLPISRGAELLLGELLLAVGPGIIVFYIIRGLHRRFTEE